MGRAVGDLVEDDRGDEHSEEYERLRGQAPADDRQHRHADEQRDND